MNSVAPSILDAARYPSENAFEYLRLKVEQGEVTADAVDMLLRHWDASHRAVNAVRASAYVIEEMDTPSWDLVRSLTYSSNEHDPFSVICQRPELACISELKLRLHSTDLESLVRANTTRHLRHLSLWPRGEVDLSKLPDSYFWNDLTSLALVADAASCQFISSWDRYLRKIMHVDFRDATGGICGRVCSAPIRAKSLAVHDGGSEGVRAIRGNGTLHEHLENLALSGGSEHFSLEVIRMLKETPFQAIRSLHLSSSAFELDPFIIIENNPALAKIEALTLKDCEIHAGEFRVGYDSLSQLKALSVNNISDSTGQRDISTLISSLSLSSWFPKMKSLHLNRCIVSDSAANHLAEALAVSAISDLVLTDLTMSSKSFAQLLTSLPSSIQSVELSRDMYCIEGVPADSLFSTFEGKNLQALRFSHHFHLGREFARNGLSCHLARTLKSLTIGIGQDEAIVALARSPWEQLQSLALESHEYFPTTGGMIQFFGSNLCDQLFHIGLPWVTDSSSVISGFCKLRDWPHLVSLDLRGMGTLEATQLQHICSAPFSHRLRMLAFAGCFPVNDFQCNLSPILKNRLSTLPC